MAGLGEQRGGCRLALLAVLVLVGQRHVHCAVSSTTTATPPGNYACPDGWTEYEGTCLWMSDSEATQTSATSVCQAKGGYLANIFSASRNQIIKGLIANTSTPVWIGLQRNPDQRPSNYEPFGGTPYIRTRMPYKWRGAGGSQIDMGMALWSTSPSTSGTSSALCVIMKADGMWYGDQSCTSNSHRYVCEQKPDCAKGWTGTTCSELCHCASFTCGSSYSACPYGCQPGWTGSKCDQEKQKPDVVYYCENATDTGPQLVLRVDVKGVNYLDFRSLDEDGMVESNCGKSNFLQTSNPAAFHLTVPVPSSPVCPGHLVANTTWTYQWTFWLAEFKNVLSEHDFIFTATCDFTKAETMQRAVHFVLNSVPSAKVTSLPQSHEEVKLQVVDADTTSDLSPLSTAVIGTRVRLAMTLTLQSGIRAKGISPKECVLSSADGSEVYTITDMRGCATGETPISKLTGNGTLQQTEVFSIFSFRRSYQLLFTCGFEFCFSDGDRNCSDRCAYSSQWSQNSGNRGKRSAPEQTHYVASAVIRVLPREVSQEAAAPEKPASRQAVPGLVVVVVGVVVVAALVGVLLSVVTVRARSALCGARRHKWTALPQSPEPF